MHAFHTTSTTRVPINRLNNNYRRKPSATTFSSIALSNSSSSLTNRTVPSAALNREGTTTTPTTTNTIVIVKKKPPFRRRTTSAPILRTTSTTRYSSSTSSSNNNRLPLIESQVSTTLLPPKITNRFKFISRRPYTRLTTPPTAPSSISTTSAAPPIIDLVEIVHQTTSIKNIDDIPKLPKPPSRKLPQILKIHDDEVLTPNRPLHNDASTPSSFSSIVTPPPVYTSSPSAQQQQKLKTIAVTFPYTFTGGSTPFLGVDYEKKNTDFNVFTAQDFVNKFTSTSRKIVHISTTVAPLTQRQQQHQRIQMLEKLIIPTESQTVTRHPQYQQHHRPLKTTDDIKISFIDEIPEHSKVLLHSNGDIECLDQGNFPHPISCRKFISCARMQEHGKLIGWEYTCPTNLSFDPIGGMCNWSADLGCINRADVYVS